MVIDEEIKNGLNIALNEAQVLGVQFDKAKEIVAVTFAPIALDKDGKIPSDNRVSFVFKNVGRFIASYRLGRWDDADAKVLTFQPEEILEKIEEFKHLPVYGGDIIDAKKESFDNWKDRLSFDYQAEKKHGMEHTIDLFQGGGDKHIDIKIWFHDLELFNSKHESISVQDFIENGKRGWDGIYQKKEEAGKFGIFPM